jgi:type VI secretion system protein ImpG
VVRMRTTAALALAPVTVARAWFDAPAQLPPQLRPAARAGARIGIALESATPLRMLPQLGLPHLRLHVDADGLLAAALLDSLFMGVLETWVEAEGVASWRRIERLPLRLGGLEADEALVPEAAHAHPAYRLLIEYFAFPDKFHFIDVDLAALAPLLPAGARRVTLHFLLAGMHADATPARILRALTAGHLAPGCAPVVNLFQQPAAPVRITQRAALYDVAPNRHEEGVEVHSIDAVHLLRRDDGKSVHVEYRPYYGLRHGEAEGSAGRRYWFAHRDDARDRMQIGFSDDDFALSGQESIASIELTCSNGQHACSAGFAAPGGDLVSETASNGLPIHLLRKPGAPLRFGSRAGSGWRLVAQLALNHRSLGELDALRDTLALYDLARSATTQRQIAGIVALTARPSTAWLRNRYGAALVHGVEVRMTINEEAFAGSSLFVFGQVLSRFLGLYVHLNSFTRLVLVAGAGPHREPGKARTKEQGGRELLRCEARCGSLALL